VPQAAQEILRLQAHHKEIMAQTARRRATEKAAVAAAQVRLEALRRLLIPAETAAQVQHPLFLARL
jgi:hypothetical protein